MYLFDSLASESRRDKTQKREKEAGFKNYDGDEQQKEKSSSTQSLKTVSSSSYAHASSSYRDGEEPITHFSSGGNYILLCFFLSIFLITFNFANI